MRIKNFLQEYEYAIVREHFNPHFSEVELTSRAVVYRERVIRRSRYFGGKLPCLREIASAGFAHVGMYIDLKENLSRYHSIRRSILNNLKMPMVSIDNLTRPLFMKAITALLSV